MKTTHQKTLSDIVLGFLLCILLFTFKSFKANDFALAVWFSGLIIDIYLIYKSFKNNKHEG